MPKISTLYECSKCGAQTSKWSGRCLECGAWGTFQAEIIDEKEKEKKSRKTVAVETIYLDTIEKQELKRIKTTINEIDRVLGGGLVPGSIILLSGEPGIGKSTIVAQIANAVGNLESPVIYSSGEESASQVSNRLERINCNLKKIKFISEINTEKIAATIEKEKPNLAIIDSIQTVYSSLIDSEPGSATQIRASTIRFLETAKKNNIAIILIGHVTKDGIIAGPKTLEHLVDTVIYLEADTNHDYRILRATKNRFGSVNELGIFEMGSNGFIEITNPASVFVDLSTVGVSGAVMSSIIEGTRPFLIEIQALVTKTIFGYPQRKSSGFDLNRLQVLTAVLIKRAGINLTNQDIILNVAGGMKANDPSLDLAVCFAIVSSLLNQKLDKQTIVLGEVGLGGEIRKTPKIKEKLEEAVKLGFKNAIIPEMGLTIKGIEIKKLKNLEEIVKNFF